MQWGVMHDGGVRDTLEIFNEKKKTKMGGNSVMKVIKERK